MSTVYKLTQCQNYLCKYMQNTYIYTVDAIVYNCLQPRKENFMNKYGNYYWYVELTNGDNLHLMADNATVCADGSLVFDTVQDEKGFPNFAIASVQWRLFYNESLIDGSTISFEEWKKSVKAKPITRISDEARILKYLADNTSSTIREIAQGVRGLTTSQIRPIVERLVNEKTLQESKVGKAIRFSLTEENHD